MSVLAISSFGQTPDAVGSDSTHTEEDLNLSSIRFFETEAATLLYKDSKVTELATGFAWLEGPLWLKRQGCLIFSDIPSHRVMRYCPETGLDTYLSESGYSNGLILNNSGKLVLMQSRSRRVAEMRAPLDAPAPFYKTLASHYNGKKLNSPNDVARAMNGALYFSDPPYGLPQQLADPTKELPYQGIYKLSPKGDVTLLDDSITYPNGILLTESDKKLIVAVSDKKDMSWYQYNVEVDGALRDRTKFASVSDYDFERGTEGLPDGLKAHSNGTIFATGPGGVWVFTENGTLLAHINIVGKPVSNLAFNSDETIVYLTAKDTLLSVQLKSQTNRVQ